MSSVCDKGKPKVGYKTAELIQDIEKVINGVKTGIVLIGVGKLGRAILDYNGFEKFGMKISAAFDNDESKTGQSENGIKILSSAQLKDYCKDNNINIGIIAVPKTYAQEICDTLVDGGVKAIWNFAPVKLKTKDGINVLQEDLSLSLAYLNLKSR